MQVIPVQLALQQSVPGIHDLSGAIHGAERRMLQSDAGSEARAWREQTVTKIRVHPDKRAKLIPQELPKVPPPCTRGIPGMLVFLCLLDYA